jgi:hypothetical protein
MNAEPTAEVKSYKVPYIVWYGQTHFPREIVVTAENIAQAKELVLPKLNSRELEADEIEIGRPYLI